VEAIVCDRISELAAKPVTEAEMARAKRLLCNDYAFSTEAPGQLAGLYGYYGTIAAADRCLTYVPTLQRYQAADLQALAAQYLTPLRYVSTILRPA
jgi:zinc protease